MSHSKSHSLHNVHVPRSRSYHSPFGRMFPKLEPWSSPEKTDKNIVEALKKFANTAMRESKGAPMLDNPNLPSGYTYFGQFVDHDLTFDGTSSLQRQNDPNKLRNFRTPRLDLDCVYGNGPADQPYLYDEDRKGMLLTHFVITTKPGENPELHNEPDLARNHQGRALIGDMRNDENLIVSQIQLALIILHNRVYAKLHGFEDIHEFDESLDFDESKFKEAQRIVRWFYQYVVWHDYIKRIIPPFVFDRLLQPVANSSRGDHSQFRSYGGRHYRWKNSPFMPVEFSVAAYRYGHSLIRPGYKVNIRTGVRKEFPIFDPTDLKKQDLKGFSDRIPNHSIQWDWFLRFPSSVGEFPQPSRKIDTTISSSVFKVPEGPGGVNSLQFLNLLRSFRMELPTGSGVAQVMGFEPHEMGDDPHEDILWHYILKESEVLDDVAMRGQQMGPVGGTIVGEVFAGLLAGDNMSYFNCFPNWNPSMESALAFDQPLPGNSDWQFSDLIRAAGMPASASDVVNFMDEGIPGTPYEL